MNRKSPLLLLPVAIAALSGCSAVHFAPKTDFDVQAWKLATADGDSLSSETLKGRVGVVVWVDPTCADVQDATASEGALRLLESRWMQDSRNIWLLYVSSRDVKDGSYMDGPMLKGWLKDQKLRGQAVIDDKGLLAKQWGVGRVPTASVVDAAGHVRWSGPAEAANDIFGYPDVSDALDSVLQGKPAPVSQKPPTKGCGISG
ncbi:MAG: hypothetical protein AAB214_00830 [Fibrobacterota bacterium]